MKKILSIFLLGFLLTSLHAQRGRVQIQDGTLVTDKGTLLRGCYIYTDGEAPMIPNKEDISAIKDFGLNCIHLYAENSCCQFSGEKEAAIDSIVKWTENDSLYLILTVGWWGGPGLEWISGFWSKYAAKYKDKTHVIFEISNEPFMWSAPYDSVTLTMEKRMYDTIRYYAPETHIQFMSYAFNINVDSAVMDIKSLGPEIAWSNASIAAHGYMYSPETTREFIRTIQDSGYAITITETPVIRSRPGARDFYPNLAFVRVFEEEFVSYIHFMEPKMIFENPSRFQLKIESSEIRWDPDFGTWPSDLQQINYVSPYTKLCPAFCDEGANWLIYDNNYSLYIDSSYSDDPYIAFYNLDFEGGPDTFLIGSSYMHNNSHAEIHLDSLNGPLLGLCQLPYNSYSDKKDVIYSCPVSNIQGVHSIYVIFKSDSFVRAFIDFILFVKTGKNSKQPPYRGDVHEIPERIEAEEYDIGGMNISYFDSTSANEGLWFRYDEVDIEPSSDTCQGYNVGWIAEGEWLEYTVSCENTYVMDIQLRIACIDPGEKIRIKINDQTLGTVTLPNTGGFQNWETIILKDIIIPAGENQILRLEFLGSGFNLNWLNFVSKGITSIHEVTGEASVTLYPNPAKNYLTIQSPGEGSIKIYSMQGQLLRTNELQEGQNTLSVNHFEPGNYVIRICSQTAVLTEILIIE